MNSEVEGKLSKIRSKIPIIALAFSLLAITVMTGANVYMTLQYNQRLTDLGFQNYEPNSTAIMISRTGDADLGKPLGYFLTNSSLVETIHYGTLHATIQILNSHYGALTILLQDFNVTASNYLDPGKLNETKVTYANQNESHTFFLAPGVNRVDADLQLKAEVYPNSEMLLSKDESVQLTLGTLVLKAEFLDFDTQIVTPSVFSADIIMTLDNYQ